MADGAHRVGTRGLHYGWFIVLSGTLCVFASIGLGRFALGMLLPSMAPSLGLDYSRMGLIGTSNFVGYLLAVLACGTLANRFGTRRLVFFALSLVGISMMMIAGVEGFISVLVLYFVTGLGSGASNVPIMALIPAWFARRRRGMAVGFVVIGSGIAILVSGTLIPFLNAAGGEGGWRLSWLVLGAAVLGIAFFCLMTLRNRPEEVGLRPVGADPPQPKAAGCALYEWESDFTTADFLRLGAIYFLFGYTYVIYATFLVTVLVREYGYSEAAAGCLWAWVGVLSLFSGPVFGTLSDRFGRKAGLATVFCIQTVSYALIALGLPGIFLYLSIACYGAVAWSIPSIMAALVGDYVGPRRAARVFGAITFVFALGQIAGPAVAGAIAQVSGSFSESFFMAASLAGVAAMLSGTLRRPEAGPGQAQQR